MKQKAFIHIFRTGNCYYIYDVNTNLFLKIPKELYNELERNGNDVDALYDNKIILDLKENGYLSCNRAEEIEHSATNTLEDLLNNALGTLTLQVTQQCNLRCKYCIYSGDYLNRSHSQKEMSIDIAKKAIDFVINHSKNTPSINISFYGGEPFLRFNFIKECVSYAKENGEGKEITFNLTSNGTLINDEIIKFLIDNDIALTISMDGPKEIHDKNRVFANGKGSFDKMMENVKKIRINFPDYAKRKIGFNIVMDGENDFCRINNFFANYDTVKDLNVMSNLVNTIGSSKKLNIKDDFFENIQYEKFKVLLHKLGRLEKKYISKLALSEFADINTKFYRKRKIGDRISIKMHPGGPCIPGINRLFMDVNGKFFPCERVSENSSIMNIGNIDDGFEVEKIKKLLNVGKVTEEKCKNCWAFRYCYLCAAHADNVNELSAEKKARFCDGVKHNAERMFKTFCCMEEFGYKPENQ